METINNICPMGRRRYEEVPIDRVKVINSRNRDKEQFDMNVESIGNVGLMKPIRVNDKFVEATGFYELICGEGRLLAHKQIGKTHALALEVAGAASLMKRWSRSRVIFEVQARYADGEPTDVEGLGDCRLAQASKRLFGSWAEAVEAAGLSDRITVVKPPRRWTADEVVAVIRRECALGKPISLIAKQQKGLQTAARIHFGRWRLAVEAAGLKCRYRFWTRESVLVEIKRRVNDGHSLSSFQRRNANLVYAARRHFGSWPAALEVAGIPRKRKISESSS